VLLVACCAVLDSGAWEGLLGRHGVLRAVHEAGDTLVCCIGHSSHRPASRIAVVVTAATPSAANTAAAVAAGAAVSKKKKVLLRRAVLTTRRVCIAGARRDESAARREASHAPRGLSLPGRRVQPTTGHHEGR
jgi:hypothetical protein